MFLKLLLILQIIIASFLNVSPMLTYVKAPSVNVYQPEHTYKMEDYKLLASIPEQHIYLYAMDWKEKKVKQRGVYRDILLDIKGKQKSFSCWIVDTNPAFKPLLILKDMNNDKRDDLVVITTKSTGTGIFIQEVHIFDTDNYNDIKVMDPIEAIYQNVKTEIVKKNGIVTITIKVREKVFTLTAKESSIGIWYDDVSFGSLIEYNVTDSKLIAKVGAQVGFGVSCGNIIMNYDYKNKRLEVSNLTFKRFANQNIFSYSYNHYPRSGRNRP